MLKNIVRFWFGSTAFSKTAWFLVVVVVFSFSIITTGNAFSTRIMGENSVSQMNLPTYYYLSELQRSINYHFQVEEEGLLCEDYSFTNNNNDNFKVICKQIDDIIVSAKEGKVITEVKVKIQAEYQIVQEIDIDLWLFRYQDTISFVRDLEFDIFVTFTTAVEVAPDLSVEVNTEWEYDWLSLPFISIGPISFRVLEQVAPRVAEVVNGYAKNKIDKTVQQAVNLPKILNQTWTNFHKPLQVYSNQNLWDYVYLENIVSGGVSIDNEKIIFPFQINFRNHMGFGSNFIRPDSFIFNNPPPESFDFNYLEITNNRFSASFPLKLSVPDMERLIFNEISARNYIVGSGNTAMKVTEVYLTSRNDFVIADIYLRGSSDNDLLSSLVLRVIFNPFFDRYTKKLRVRYLTYEIIRSDSLLVDIVNAINEDSFSQRLEEGIVLELSGYVESIHKLLNEQLAEFQFNENLKFKATLDKLDISNIIKSDQNLYIFVELKGGIILELVNLF